jgi:hypothetical protein
MYHKIFNMGLVLMFLFGAAGGNSQKDTPPDDFNLDNYEFLPDQLLVSFEPSIGKERANKILEEIGVERIRSINSAEEQKCNTRNPTTSSPLPAAWK